MKKPFSHFCSLIYLFLLSILLSCQGQISINTQSKVLEVAATPHLSTTLIGTPFSYDFDLVNVSASESVVFDCSYDQVVDNNVGSSQSCTNISGLAFDNATGEFDWTPEAAQIGNYEFLINATAGEKTGHAIFTLKIVNASPVIDAIADQVIAEGDSITPIDANDSGDDLDADAEPITYTCFYDNSINGSVSSTIPCSTIAGILFNSSTGEFTWTTINTQAKDYEFKITGTDGLTTDDEFFSITVTPTNFAPTIAAIANQTVSEGSAITPINANDGGDDFDDDGDALIYSCSVNAADCSTISGINFNLMTGTITWTPSYSQAGVYNFTITADDGALTDTENFTITVTNTNRAPVLDAINNQTVPEGTAITSIDAADGGDDLDIDGEALSYTCSVNTADCSTVAGISFLGATGVMTWTPNGTQSGVYNFVITGSDGSLTDNESFTITVTNLNQAPVLDVIADESVSAGTPITTVNAGDGGDDLDSDGEALTYQCFYDRSIDGSVLTVTSCSGLSGLSFNTSTGVMDWTPSVSQLGSYEFMIRASDGTSTAQEIFVITTTSSSFISKWRTTSASEGIALPLVSGYNYNFNVDWGDGTSSIVTAWDDGNKNHTYADAGDYIVEISGTVEAWSFAWGGSNNNIIEVTNLGVLGWKNLNAAFAGCENLTSFNAGSTDTSAVTDLDSFFDYAIGLTTADFTGFSTASVTDMSNMFYSNMALTSLDISGFDTTNVIDMSLMFGYCSSLTSLDLSHFNTINVTDMSSMFSDMTSLVSLNLSNFNTSNVTNMEYMFRQSAALISLDLSSFQTASVTLMNNMFQSTSSLTSLDISNFNTSAVTTMGRMFAGTGLTSLDLSHFDVSNVTVMNSMFENASSLLTLTLNTWDISHNPTATTIFNGMTGDLYCDQPGLTMFGKACVMVDVAPNLDAIANQSANGGTAITPINANDGGDDFDGNGEALTYACYYDTAIDGSVASTNDCTTLGIAFNTSTGSFTWTPSYIQGGNYEFKITASDSSQNDEVIFTIDVTVTQYVAQYNITADGENLILPLVSGYNYNFTVDWGDGSSSTVSAWNDANATHTYATAGDYLVVIDGVMEALGYPSDCNIKRVYNLGLMNWKNLASAFETNKLISFKTGNTDTSLVTDLSWTFEGTTNLASADFTGFDTSSVITMEGTFYGTGLTALDVSSFDTRNAVNMSSMFYNTSLLSLNVSNFRNNSATNMSSMFGYSSNLANINLSGFNTPLVTDMSHMFAGISATDLDLSSFDTSNVTTFASMFKWSPQLQTINLSSFNTSSATSFNQMFMGTSSLTSLDLQNFNTSAVTNMGQTFSDMTGLIFLDLSGWDISSAPTSTNIYLGTPNISTALHCDQGGSPATGSMFGVDCN